MLASHESVQECLAAVREAVRATAPAAEAIRNRFVPFADELFSADEKSRLLHEAMDSDNTAKHFLQEIRKLTKVSDELSRCCLNIETHPFFEIDCSSVK